MTLIKQIFIITATFGLPAPQQVEKIILKKKRILEILFYSWVANSTIIGFVKNHLA